VALVAVMCLAHACGLSHVCGLCTLVAQLVRIGTSTCCNPASKITSIVAGMVKPSRWIEAEIS
jgi:hypothetical protein